LVVEFEVLGCAVFVIGTAVVGVVVMGVRGISVVVAVVGGTI
jgi:hypothetical protein